MSNILLRYEGSKHMLVEPRIVHNQMPGKKEERLNSISVHFVHEKIYQSYEKKTEEIN